MSGRLWAVIPAAGLSTRMGQPKLLLPLGEQTVIERVVAALKQAGIAECLVVCRPDDTVLAEVARCSGARVIQPDRSPPQMKDSVQVALQWIAAHGSPEPTDGWMLIPADHPTIDSAVVRQLAAAWTQTPHQIVVPSFNGQRGHPTIFPWTLVPEVLALGPDEGLNQLVRCDPTRRRECPVDQPSVLWDMDTPADYERLLRSIGQGFDAPR